MSCIFIPAVKCYFNGHPFPDSELGFMLGRDAYQASAGESFCFRCSGLNFYFAMWRHDKSQFPYLQSGNQIRPHIGKQTVNSDMLYKC